MWDDPERIAAMLELEGAPPARPTPTARPVPPAVKALLDRLDDSVAGSKKREVYTRVVKALVPIFLDMRALRDGAFTDEAKAKELFDMTIGVLKGLDMAIGTVMTYVPPDYAATAIKELFKSTGANVEVEIRK
jgi:hypothetical protein